MSIEKKMLPKFGEMKKKTVGESYKALNLLIKGKSIEDFKNLQEILVPSQPLTKFEETLRLIIIDELHLKDEVIKIFLNQNDWHIKRVLRCKWFFKNALTGDEFISEIFPQISFCLRCKIITKLSKYLESEVEAEKIAEFLYQNFSCELAETLLPKCSETYITSYLAQVKPKFHYNTSSRVLLNLSKRYPEIVGNIFTEIFETELLPCNGSKKVLMYLATQKDNVFISLLDRFPSKMICCNLGRKLSRSVGLKLKESVFKSNKISAVLNKKYMFLNFSEEDQVKYLVATVINSSKKLSFASWKLSDSAVAFLLKLITYRRRLFVINAVFKEIFDSNFQEHPMLWTNNVLELLPINDRLFFVQILEKLLEKGENEFQFSFQEPELLYYLYEFETAFKKLKEILLKSPEVHRRQSILKYMVRNCYINRDINGLQQVVDLIEKRHRNDQLDLIEEFIGLVLKLFPKSILPLKILEKLESLAYFCALKGSIYGYRNVAEKLILYRLDKNMDVNALLEKNFSISILKSGFAHFIENFKSEHAKWLIFFYAKKLGQWVKTNSSENKKNNNFARLLNTLQQFNKLNKKNPILVKELSNLEQEFKRHLKEKYKDLGGENWSLDIWQRFYSRIIYTPFDPKILVYIFKTTPDFIAKHLNNILKAILKDNTQNMNLIIVFKRTMSFLGLFDAVKQLLLTEFRNGNRVALMWFSHLADVEEFSTVIADYLPKKEQIDERKDSSFLQVQLLVPSLIKNLYPRYKNLNLILKFFIGDFLKSVMPSLYVCIYHTRTDEALLFLKKQLTQVPDRISYKKDFIRLIVSLSSRQERISFCLNFWEENSHYSIRTILFSWISKSFLEIPTDEGFEALKKCVLESDEMVISARPPFNQISEKYLFEYVSAFWEFSEKQSQMLKNEFQNIIFCFFNKKNMKVLPKDFCEKIIMNKLFKAKTLYNIQYFAIYYLIFDSEDIQERLSWLLKLIKNVPPAEHGLISDFLKNLCKISLEDDTSYVYIFNSLLSECPMSYEERLSLTYYSLYHQISESNNSLVDCYSLGKEIRNFYLGLSDLSDLVVLLVDSLSGFFKELKNSNKPFDELLAIEGLIMDASNRSLSILGIYLLPSDSQELFSTNETFGAFEISRKEKLKEIVSVLQSFNDEIVNIYLNRKLAIPI